MWGAEGASSLAKRTSEVIAALRNGMGSSKRQRTDDNQFIEQLQSINTSSIVQQQDKESQQQQQQQLQQDKENVPGSGQVQLSEIVEYECAVCLEKITEQGVLNCCDHLFCFACIYKWSRRANLCPLCKRRFSQITKRRPGQPHGRRRRTGEKVRVRRKDLGSRQSDDEDEEQERRRRMLMRQEFRQMTAGNATATPTTPAIYIVVDDTPPDVQWIPSFQISDDENGMDDEEEEVIEILPPPSTTGDRDPSQREGGGEEEQPSAPQVQWSSEIIDLTSWADTETRPAEPQSESSRLPRRDHHIIQIFDESGHPDDNDIIEVYQPQEPNDSNPNSSPSTNLTIDDDSPLIIRSVHRHQHRHHRHNRHTRRSHRQPNAPTISARFPPTLTTTTTTTTTPSPTTPPPSISLSVEDDDSWLNQTVF